MNLVNLKKIISILGGTKIFVKALAPNDNSKNQVYLGGSFDILNDFPVSDITADTSGDWERERFKAKLNFAWISGRWIIINSSIFSVNSLSKIS